MDLQQHILNISGVFLPISGGDGTTMSNAVIIGSEAKYELIQVENKSISAMLDEGYWRKVEQSLISVDEKEYDKITIRHFLNDGEVAEMIFWFEVTECFGI